MSNEQRCGRCGTTLTGAGLGGACPHCLLLLAQDDDADTATPGQNVRDQAPVTTWSPSSPLVPGSLVPSLARLAFIAAAVTFVIIATVQVHDAIVWATTPWLGFTLGDHGRVLVREQYEIPAALRELYEEHSLHLLAVAPGADWLKLTDVTDWPPFHVWSRPRAPWERLCEVLRAVPVGTVVGVRLTTETGEIHELQVKAQALLPGIVFERTVLYGGIGIAILVVGAAVLRARPASGQALAFAILTACFGGQLLCTQVLGGFPSRFYWLSLVGCYATPAAAAMLALVLEPTPWWRRYRWVLGLPWVGAIAGWLVASVRGDVLHDSNLEVSVLRAAGWLFFASYLLWARWRTPDRSKRRSFEYYLAGMAITFALPTWHYTQLSAAPGDIVSPWVMTPLALFPLIIGYGVWRARLFDAEVVLRRGLSLTALMFVAALTWGLLTAIASVIVGNTQPMGSPLWMAVLAAVALTLGGMLRPRLQALVDRGVNPSRFRYLETLRRASDEIADLKHENEVADRVVEIAMNEINLRGAAVFIRHSDGFRLAASGGVVRIAADSVLDPNEPIVALPALVGSEFHIDDFAYNPRLASVRHACVMRMNALGIDMVMPMRAGGAPFMGLLVLSSRSDGEPLNVEDVELLKLILGQSAQVIARVRSDANTSIHAVAQPPRRPTVGHRIGHYLLEEHLGSGGMGAVFQARDERLDRLVALKFIHAERTASVLLLERLRREARALATLNHPGIMHIFALEEADGHTFLSVELLKGRTLRKELEARGPLPAREVVDVSLALADALGYALANDVIHRDIKLDNVMRTTSGAIKLMDFGLAKLSGSDDSNLTDPGHVLGTPAYMAPELLSGGAATFRSDLYALGIALETLLSGRELWTRFDLARTKPLAPATLRTRGVPEPLLDLVLRLLEVAPLARYTNYAELTADLKLAGHKL